MPGVASQANKCKNPVLSFLQNFHASKITGYMLDHKQRNKKIVLTIFLHRSIIGFSISTLCKNSVWSIRKCEIIVLSITLYNTSLLISVAYRYNEPTENWTV